MKKLGKLQIKPEKLMRNEELISFKGGIDNGWLTCRIDGEICWSSSIQTCELAREACDAICGSWSEAVCVGY